MDLDTIVIGPRVNGIRMYGIGQPGNVDVDPNLLVFDDTARNATITFSNPTLAADTLWLARSAEGMGNLSPIVSRAGRRS